MDPDIELQIKVDVLGLQNVSALQQAMQKLHAMQGTIKDGNEKNVGAWEKLRNALDRIEQKYDAVFRAGFRLQNLGADLTRMGQASLSVLKDSVDQWGDFEFAMNRAAGAFQIWSNTLPIYEALQRGIYKVAQEVRVFPAEDVARAFYFWGSTTGQVVENTTQLAQVMRGLTTILKAAAITETDLEQSIKGVYSILVQYDLGLNSTRDVTEKLMLITQRTAAEFPDLINSFKMVGPIAASLGITFDQVVQYVGLLADAGIRGTMAGRALRQTFVKLVDPTARAKNALDAAFEATDTLGKGFDEIVFPDGEFIGFTSYVDILADVMEDMNMHQKNQLLGIITTQNELPALTALINRQIEARRGNTNAIDDEKFSLAGAHEQFERTFDLLEGSWVGITGLWQNSVIPLVHLVGAEVAKLMGPVLTFFSEVAQSVHKFLRLHPEVTEFIVKVVGLTSVALLLAGAFFTVAGTLLVFGAGVAMAIESLAAVSEHIGPLISKFAKFGAGIAFLALLIITDFGGIRGALGNLVSAFEGIIGFIVRILDQASATFDFFAGIIMGVVGWVDEFLKSMGRIDFSTEMGAMEDLTTALGILGDMLTGTIGIILGIGLTIMAVTKVIALFTLAWGAVNTVIGFFMAQRFVMLLTLKALEFNIKSNIIVTKLWAIAVGLVRGAMTLLMAHPVILFLAVLAGSVYGVIQLFNTWDKDVRELGEDINYLAMDFGDMGAKLRQVSEDTGRDYDSLKHQVSEYMSEHRVGFETAIAHVEQYREATELSSEGARDYSIAMGEQSASMEDVSEATAELRDELLATGMPAEQVEQAMVGVESSIQGVGEAIDQAKWADTIVGQLHLAAAAGRREARLIPSEIAAGILEGQNDIVNAALAVGTAYTAALVSEARIVEIRTKMGEANQAIIDATAEGNRQVVLEEQANYATLELELAGHLQTMDPLSQEAAAIFARYAVEATPATTAAYNALYTAQEERALVAQYNIEEYANQTGIGMEEAIKRHQTAIVLAAELLAMGVEVPIEQLVTELPYAGETAVRAMAAAIEEHAFLAGTATGVARLEAEAELKLLLEMAEQYGYDMDDELAAGVERGVDLVEDQAEAVATAAMVRMETLDWTGSGERIGNTWAYGLSRAQQAVRIAAWNLSQTAYAAMHGQSPPKEGPLKNIDRGGMNVGIAWADGLTAAAPYAAAGAAALASSVASSLNSDFQGAVFGTTMDANTHKVIDLNVQVSSPDGSVTNANAQVVADAVREGLMLDRLEHMVTVG